LGSKLENIRKVKTKYLKFSFAKFFLETCRICSKLG
jgi:hypothetical protein